MDTQHTPAQCVMRWYRTAKSLDKLADLISQDLDHNPDIVGRTRGKAAAFRACADRLVAAIGEHHVIASD